MSFGMEQRWKFRICSLISLIWEFLNPKDISKYFYLSTIDIYITLKLLCTWASVWCTCTIRRTTDTKTTIGQSDRLKRMQNGFQTFRNRSTLMNSMELSFAHISTEVLLDNLSYQGDNVPEIVVDVKINKVDVIFQLLHLSENASWYCRLSTFCGNAYRIADESIIYILYSMVLLEVIKNENNTSRMFDVWNCFTK